MEMSDWLDKELINFLKIKLKKNSLKNKLVFLHSGLSEYNSDSLTVTNERKLEKAFSVKGMGLRGITRRPVYFFISKISFLSSRNSN